MGWVIERLTERRLLDQPAAAHWRVRLQRTDDNATVAEGLRELYADVLLREAA
jgi:hypothetical protein